MGERGWHVSLHDLRAVYDPEMHIAMLQDSSRHRFYAKCLLKHQEDLKGKAQVFRQWWTIMDAVKLVIHNHGIPQLQLLSTVVLWALPLPLPGCCGRGSRHWDHVRHGRGAWQAWPSSCDRGPDVLRSQLEMMDKFWENMENHET